MHLFLGCGGGGVGGDISKGFFFIYISVPNYV